MTKDEALYLNVILLHVGIGFLVFLFPSVSKNLWLCFLAFWFLTINHAAMRAAAPAFVYSLSLINVYFGTPLKNKVSSNSI